MSSNFSGTAKPELNVVEPSVLGSGTSFYWKMEEKMGRVNLLYFSSLTFSVYVPSVEAGPGMIDSGFAGLIL